MGENKNTNIRVIHETIALMVTRKRHVAKTLTWRATATTTTIVITWMVTGHIEAGLTVGGFEAVAKMLLYYAHERAWLKTRFGITSGGRTAEANE